MDALRADRSNSRKKSPECMRECMRGHEVSTPAPPLATQLCTCIHGYERHTRPGPDRIPEANYCTPRVKPCTSSTAYRLATAGCVRTTQSTTGTLLKRARAGRRRDTQVQLQTNTAILYSSIRILDYTVHISNIFCISACRSSKPPDDHNRRPRPPPCRGKSLNRVTVTDRSGRAARHRPPRRGGSLFTARPPSLRCRAR